MSRAAIVIASHGRAQQLQGCLDTVRALEGGPYEVIVVDDGSPQPYAEALGEIGPEVRIVRQDNAGPAAARNRGVAEAQADVVLFTDDDCRPDPAWACRLLAAHDADPDRLVGGRVINGLDDNAFSRAAQAILSYSYGTFEDFSAPLAFFTTNNLCVAKDRFRALGGFDTSFRFASEDRDFSFRWKQAGGRLVYARDAAVVHQHRMSLRSFVRQQYLYGRGARRFHGKVAQGPGNGVALGSAGFYAGLLLHPLRRPSPRAATTSFLIGVAHVAMITGYLKERRTPGA